MLRFDIYEDMNSIQKATKTLHDIKPNSIHLNVLNSCGTFDNILTFFSTIDHLEVLHLKWLYYINNASKEEKAKAKTALTDLFANVQELILTDIAFSFNLNSKLRKLEYDSISITYFELKLLPNLEEFKSKESTGILCIDQSHDKITKIECENIQLKTDNATFPQLKFLRTKSELLNCHMPLLEELHLNKYTSDSIIFPTVKKLGCICNFLCKIPIAKLQTIESLVCNLNQCKISTYQQLIEIIKNLTNLKEVILNNCNLQKPAEFKLLTTLKHLVVYINGGSYIYLPTINIIPEMPKLILSRVKITGNVSEANDVTIVPTKMSVINVKQNIDNIKIENSTDYIMYKVNQNDVVIREITSDKYIDDTIYFNDKYMLRELTTKKPVYGFHLLACNVADPQSFIDNSYCIYSRYSLFTNSFKLAKTSVIKRLYLSTHFFDMDMKWDEFDNPPAVVTDQECDECSDVDSDTSTNYDIKPSMNSKFEIDELPHQLECLYISNFYDFYDDTREETEYDYYGREEVYSIRYISKIKITSLPESANYIDFSFISEGDNYINIESLPSGLHILILKNFRGMITLKSLPEKLCILKIIDSPDLIYDGPSDKRIEIVK